VLTEDQRVYIREFLKVWRARRRHEAIVRLGGKCVACSEKREFELEFDHIDPKTKVASIAEMMTAAKAIFDAEVAKCQLMCKSCHKKKTRKQGGYTHYAAAA
jgi:5-methylcytosine-specific restriction endonuclease McrA